MRKTIAGLGAFGILLISIASCNKKQEDKISAPLQANQFINATVSSGQTFVFNAGTSGTLSVNRQASHYQVSETTTNNGLIIYNYNSVAGFTGADEVALSYTVAASNSSAGSSCTANHNEATTTIIVIKLNVTN